MNLFNGIKRLFRKPEYYAFDDFDINDYEPKFQFLSDEILMDISRYLRKKFNPGNLHNVMLDLKNRINDEINESEDYRKENNFIITYFFHEDFFNSGNTLFISQCISSNDKEIGNVISNLWSFEKRDGILIIQNID